ncbi:metal ABC transporter substrate-binding protein [Peribacillus asahii]|uniref:metal ABC transporter substrate-binding protein n=1 Tax=Peribacillus asahii TaxID=228899 RepID=UPI00380E2B2A
MKKLKRLLCAIIGCFIILSGCSNGKQVSNEKGKEDPEKLQIITTFYPMYYFTKQITGNLANVEILIPNGVEPHDWEPTSKDMINMQEADVFIYNSRYFETWTEKVLDSIDSSNLNVVEASNGIGLMDSNIEEEQHDHEDSEAMKDPHVWLSPILAQKEVDNIAEVLEKADPKNKEQYEKNADAFKAELTDLDKLYKGTIDKAPRKEFVTQHAAFGYLAKQYGLTQIPIAGLSPDVEPTLAKLAELTEMMKKKKIEVVYFEELTSPKVAKTLANETGAKTEVLNPLEGLTKDEQEQGLDYIGVMEKNLEALKVALYNSK